MFKQLLFLVSALVIFVNGLPQSQNDQALENGGSSRSLNNPNSAVNCNERAAGGCSSSKGQTNPGARAEMGSDWGLAVASTGNKDNPASRSLGSGVPAASPPAQNTKDVKV